ncbi:MarR family winged helix-turn-helix transcriptional regulator [Microbacterium invictum]|uniref:DNA-binding MarR family transcriptional regulator n=1 Tax=Microbacterium invictum TaxID=515415 RepID=A0AA40VN35_9MICO|nr:MULTISPECIES: MarR family winged helix-turn-helix transcriptional regulator [Microbacterium]MBB4140477.1 DNA-binding MarR family transcriptional regulator [Microbacterium invictum]
MSKDARRSDVPDDGSAAPEFRLLAELVIDVAREIQLRAVQTTPVVPLTQTQGQVMRYVHNHPECSASDIADGSGLQRANVSTALRELRGRGYITSRRDDVDGRAIRIASTGLADQTIERLRASWADLIAHAWAGGDDPAGNSPGQAIEVLDRIRSGLIADRASTSFAAEGPEPVASAADSTVMAGTGADRARPEPSPLR